MPKIVKGRLPANRKTRLRWRRTRIREWREAAGLTQQQVADRLDARGVGLDRVSVARIEAGQQMPTIEVLEALAGILKTDVDSMLNFMPEQAQELAKLRNMEPAERERLLRAVRAGIGGK